MDEIMEKTRELRECDTRHYNCCQSVLIPFCAQCGVSEEQADALGGNFGSGMRCGSTCGALTGALMTLGLAGAGEGEARELTRRFRTKNGCLDCAGLLKAAKERGEAKKDHCDRMVYEAVEALEELLP